MLEIEYIRHGFKTKTIWFSETPFDIRGYDTVVFHGCRKNVDVEGFSKREFTTPIIDLTQDLDTIWKKMSKSSCRYAIRKAESKGVKVVINQRYEDFLDMNRRFRMKKDLPAYNVNIDFMKKYGTLLISMIDGVILGGQFYLKDDMHMRWLLGASNRLESANDLKSLIGDANKMLVWKAIMYAKDTNIEEFDLGGYYTGEKFDAQMEGINFFKKSFGGDVITHYIYEKDYSMTYLLAKKVLRYVKR